MSNCSFFIWGTGNLAEKVIHECSILEQYKIIGFIDNDVCKVGKSFKNYQVYSPDILCRRIPDKIIILSNFYKDIKRQIKEKYPHVEDLVEDQNYFYKEMIIKRYKNSDDKEIKEIIQYLKVNNLDVFNYKFRNKYKELEVNVLFDDICQMFYVYHCGKRMYFAKRYNTREKVKDYYKFLLVEQDEESPHRYLTSAFNVKEGDIVIDVGVAEGNFALEIIDKVSRIYLIETDDEWIEAIKETFRSYQDKIVIINKYITSINAGKFATLDSLIEEPVNFIKMDIEGNEWDALLGAKNIITCSGNIKCAICIYHQDFDEIIVKDIMNKYGLSCSTTKGYMWFPYGERQTYISTKLCRGIMRGVKKGRTE